MRLKIVELSSFCQQKLENVILYNPFSIRWRENEKKILRGLYLRTLMKLYIFIPCRWIYICYLLIWYDISLGFEIILFMEWEEYKSRISMQYIMHIFVSNTLEYKDCSCWWYHEICWSQVLLSYRLFSSWHESSSI